MKTNVFYIWGNHLVFCALCLPKTGSAYRTTAAIAHQNGGCACCGVKR